MASYARTACTPAPEERAVDVQPFGEKIFELPRELTLRPARTRNVILLAVSRRAA